ncbi:MAG: S-layer homology domain-containing protein, partial [Oscillospiraceae bacterium]|nr:S-layer homology domain-containing protein [Oscillospiraceae bacterium]
LTYNVAYASCTDSGYTGDTKCEECGQIFKMGKTIYPFGHDWDDGVLLKEATVTERGEMLYTCTKKHYVAGEGLVPCGETKVEYIPRLSDTTVDVTAAEVSVTAPVKGKAPANATASGGQFTVANTAWEPVPDSTFASSTVYSVVVTLEANEGYRFTSATAFKVNGSAATIVTRSTQEAKISFTFPATASSGSSGSGSGSSGSGSSSGGSGVSTYAITVASAKHGSVTASDKTAAKGDTVTLTVKPDKDYALDTLTVTDGSGDELKLEEKNGKYTFTMPASKVTVKAAFAAVKAEQPEQPVAVNPFTDVAEGAYYYDAVQWAVGQGITKGTTETTFSPGNTCTRAQIVTFLWRAFAE